MTRDDLIELLKKHEWRDVEFKEAQREVPKDAYESVSAFANAEGGHLVFGVKKNGHDFAIVGMLDVDKVQNDFLTTLRQPDKISAILDVQEELHQHEGSELLIFYIPEASRAVKPVYLNGDIRRSFIRKGGCDIRCSKEERDRFLIDAAAERYDSQAIEVNPSTAFDTESLRWYRGVVRDHRVATRVDVTSIFFWSCAHISGIKRLSV